MARNRSKTTAGTAPEREQQQLIGSSSSIMSGNDQVATASEQERPRSLQSNIARSLTPIGHVNVAMAMDNDGHDNNANLPRRSARIRQNTDNSTGQEEDVDQLQEQAGSDITLASTAPGTESPEGTTATRRGGTRHGVQTENEDSRFVLQWVRENYQYEEEHNVPRSGMYEHYRATCQRINANPVNSATFGKLIRHVFPNITTRRLGTRGQSRYHYCGIRRRMGPPSIGDNPQEQQVTPSSSSTLSLHHGDGQQDYTAESSMSIVPENVNTSGTATRGYHPPTPHSSQRQRRQRRTRGAYRWPYSQHTRGIRGTSEASPERYSSMEAKGRSSSSSSVGGGQRASHQQLVSSAVFRGTSIPASAPVYTGSSDASTSPSAFVSPRVSSFLLASESGSAAGAAKALPFKRFRSSELMTQGISKQQDIQLPSFTTFTFVNQSEVMMEFALLYKKHCTDILDMIRTGQLRSIYGSLVGFYQMLPDRFRILIDEKPAETTELIWRWDCALYDSIIASMLPTVHSPLTYEMNKALRQYTRDLAHYLDGSLDGYPEILRERKGQAACIFVSKFRRHLKLNQMAQAAAGLLRRQNTLQPMLSDWEKVDVASILDQTHWTCDCENREIQRMINFDIGNLLASEASIEHWITWMQGVVERYMSTHQQNAQCNAGYFIFYAKQFVLKWSIYTSLILKDMTLSGAKSIDQFRILALFFDDMMQFLVESRVAKAMAPQLQQPSVPTQHHNRRSVPPASSSSVGVNAPSVHHTGDTRASSSSSAPQM